MSSSHSIALFSYGTLQLEAVQKKSFGRVLDGRDDAIPGFKKEMIEISDPDVLKVSGERFHPVVSASVNSNDEVAGKVFFGSVRNLVRGAGFILGLEPVSKDDSELSPRFEPFSRWRFPSVACVVENQIQ